MLARCPPAFHRNYLLEVGNTKLRQVISCRDIRCLEALEAVCMNIYAVRFCMPVVVDEACTRAIHARAHYNGTRSPLLFFLRRTSNLVDAHLQMKCAVTHGHVLSSILDLLAGEWAMRWPHRDAGSQSEWSRGRPEAAAQAQRGPGVGGWPLIKRTPFLHMRPPHSGNCITLDVHCLLFRTRMETAPCTTRRSVMRAPSSRCCRGAAQT